MPPIVPARAEPCTHSRRGGLPRARNAVIFGGPGCGKPLLGLQTLINGARRPGEPGIFVAIEELRHYRLVLNAQVNG